MGWMGLDGWMDGSLGLVEYRAPYGANKLFIAQYKHIARYCIALKGTVWYLYIIVLRDVTWFKNCWGLL